MSLKEIFDLPYFHGRLTDEEAYNLCQEELTNTSKTHVYIWYLSEIDGELEGRVRGYRRDSEVPFVAFGTPTQHLSYQRNCTSLDAILCLSKELQCFNLLERKNPHQLQELARIAILDSFVDYCCLKNLIQRINELRLPAMEKEELKKLVRGFQLILASKIPNEL